SKQHHEPHRRPRIQGCNESTLWWLLFIRGPTFGNEVPRGSDQRGNRSSPALGPDPKCHRYRDDKPPRQLDITHGLLCGVCSNQGNEVSDGHSQNGQDGKHQVTSLLDCGTECCSSSSASRSEEHTSELQSRFDLVCRL